MDTTDKPSTTPAPDAARNKTPAAIMACANWLHYCLSIGWSKRKLDALNDLWWEHHDDEGKLI